MAAPAAVVAARVAVLLIDDLLLWGLLTGAVALVMLLLPILLPILGFGAILALFSGLSGTSQGGGPVWGEPNNGCRWPDPRRAAGAEAASGQLGFVHAALDRARDHRQRRVGVRQDRRPVVVGRRLWLRTVPRRTWQSYGGGIPWRTTDPKEQAKPIAERQDSTNFHYALPAMARYLCADGAGTDLRKAIFAYNHADSYVAEVVQLAARYGGIGASGGGLIDGWADRPPLNQYDSRNYRSDQSWLTWRDADCSAAALDWLLGAYGRTVGSLNDAIALIGPSTASRRPWACSANVGRLWRTR